MRSLLFRLLIAALPIMKGFKLFGSPFFIHIGKRKCDILLRKFLSCGNLPSESLTLNCTMKTRHRLSKLLHPYNAHV
jgi:hypothetical protein